ncbi:MFS general substrate transporter, partial [Trematosphaeria pertusa]
WRFYATGVCMCLVNLVMAWDATAISIALPTIAAALHGSAIQSFWLGISFFAAATAFLPLFSAFSDIFGRKAMLLTGLAFFTIGSFIAAVGGNFNALHLGRSVQGIGAGGIFVLSDLIVSDLVSSLDKRRWTTILGTMWAIGAVTGPALGEALAERNQWRWIFWLNLPFCIIAFLILPFFAQLKAATPGSIFVKLRAIDWVGFLLLSGSLVSMLLGISWGGTLHTWSNPNTLLPLQFGLIGIVVFCVWSWFSPFPSIISLDGFMDRTSLATYFGTMIQGTIICAFLYFMPFYFSVAKPELSHLPAGVRWFPWTLPLVIFILITFVVVSRWNTWLPSIWLGWVLVLLGVALTTIYARTSPTGTWVSIAIVLGSGVGILYPSLHTASELIAEQEEEDNGKSRRAVTNYTFFQLLGKSFGVAIATSVFENEFFKHLRSNPLFERFAKEYTTDAVALVTRVRATTGGEGSPKTQIADAYVDSLKTIWILMAVLAGLALVVSCFMMPKESRKKQDVEMKNLDEGYVV